MTDGPAPIDGVIPLVTLSFRCEALQASCLVQAAAESPERVEDAMALLADLDQAWGPGGELEQVRTAPVGVEVALSWDTVLLLGRSELPGLALDLERHTGTRVGPVEWPDLDAQHALAAELITCELIASGCLAARVDVGEFRSSANRGVRVDFAGA